MQKIPTLFLRNPEDMRHVLPEVHPDCQWVLDGQGVATRKYDGTCVMLDEDGLWWARREVKEGKTVPPEFVEVEFDPATGKTVGWEPAGQSAFFKYLTDALGQPYQRRSVGTYELCGPMVNRDPEGFDTHVLIRHDDAEELEGVPRDFEKLAVFLVDFPHEGVVWHHEDGRMAKLKRRDFPRSG